MKTRKIGRPSPAMIIAVVALIMAMAGTGYAAFKVPKKSVGTAQLKKNAVTNAKIKNHTITGKKLNLKKLGVVPNAAHASVADSAGTIPANPVHVVGAAGEPTFLNGFSNLGSLPESPGIGFPPVSFLKDHDNVVHLEGVIRLPSGEGTPIAFQLPPGYRPPSGDLVEMAINEAIIAVIGSNMVIEGNDLSGDVIIQPAGSGEPFGVILTGVSFLAGS